MTLLTFSGYLFSYFSILIFGFSYASPCALPAFTLISTSDISMVTGLSVMFESFASIVLNRMALCCSSGVIRLNFQLWMKWHPLASIFDSVEPSSPFFADSSFCSCIQSGTFLKSNTQSPCQLTRS